MKITVLVENSSAVPSLRAEHGLSLWIETGEQSILFDTGASDAFAANARELGVDLSKADAIVLSHGHYDHAGGLATALDACSAPLFIGVDATIARATRSETGFRQIGMDPATVGSLGERVRVIDTPRDIGPGVRVLTAAACSDVAPSGTGSWRPSDNERLLRATDHGYEQDPFDDELSLLVAGERGPILVTGCSHRGIVNICAAAGDSIGAVVGGLHLSHEPDPVVRETGRALGSVGSWYLGHCTGERAIEILESSVRGPIERIRCGSVLEL